MGERMTSLPQLVALYARVSKEQGQEAENQLAEMRQFCKRIGWEIVAEYIDHETGSSDEREQFKAMFADASRRKFDVLVFWALDRLSREGALETLQHLNRLSGYGVGYKSFTEQYLDSCGMFKEAIISILAAIAKQERIRISERTKAGLARVRARGTRLGRPTVDVNADLLAKRRSQGASIRTLAREFDISPTQVARTLRKAVPKR